MSAPAVLYGVDDIVQNDLPRRVADVVHLLNPHHLILRFHRFGHFLLIRHLTDELFLHIHGSLFDIVKVLSQRTVRQEIVVQDSVMITEESPTHLCVDAELHLRLFGQGQVGQIVIALSRISNSHHLFSLRFVISSL